MQLSVTITSLGGPLVIQDPHPVHGIFSKTVPANGSKTFTCDWDIWHRISSKIEAYRAAGLCTVALSEVTPTGTDNTSGPNTTYNRSDWALLNSFRKDITAIQSTIGTLVSPFLYKGAIAVNTNFPLLAVVQAGWLYTLTADVTDNAGATYTNTGLAFLAGDEIVWSGATWVKVGSTLTNPLQFKGVIANAAAFPPPAATATTGVKDGFVYRCTAAVIDNDATKTNTSQEFLLGDIIMWYSGAWYVIGNANTLIDIGAITLNSDFPSPTSVKRGYCYRILADVIDNGGASKTNTGQVFSAGDQIMWDGVSAWVILSASFKMIEKGTIAAPTGFPPIASVKRGYVYRITANTSDNGGVSYTNTGLSFKEGDVIEWNGSTWITLGNKVNIQVTAVTPVVLAANDSVNIVDTATLGAPSAVALPAATAGIAGRRVTVADGSGDCVAHNIVITPDTTDTINGVNAAITLDSNYEFVTLQCIAAGDWIIVESNARAVAATSDGLMSSADKTKLDGIEAAADVTDAANVASAGAIMASVLTERGDILFRDATVPAALPHGSAGDLLTSGGHGADPSWSSAIPVAVAAIVDDHVFAKVTGLDLKTDEQELSATLSGAAGKRFLATHVLVKSSTNVGAVNSDGTINIGTAADGAQIAAALALTGVAAVDTARMIPLAAHSIVVAGNATLYVNVESAETGAGTLAIDVTVVGRQI